MLSFNASVSIIIYEIYVGQYILPSTTLICLMLPAPPSPSKISMLFTACGMSFGIRLWESTIKALNSLAGEIGEVYSSVTVKTPMISEKWELLLLAMRRILINMVRGFGIYRTLSVGVVFVLNFFVNWRACIYYVQIMIRRKFNFVFAFLLCINTLCGLIFQRLENLPED